MTWFADNSIYTYMVNHRHPPQYNIGWLDAGHPFPCGKVSEEFIDRLWHFCHFQPIATLGIHGCELCNKPYDRVTAFYGDDVFLLGSAEIRAIGTDGRIYAAPNLIFHYVTKHQYLPPKEFIDAILFGPQPESNEYQQPLLEVGAIDMNTFYWPPSTG
jgi:hypothetical protein